MARNLADPLEEPLREFHLLSRDTVPVQYSTVRFGSEPYLVNSEP